MNRAGVVEPGRDAFQEYTYKLKGVLTDRELWIVGGDDRIGPLQVDVVDSPTLTHTMLHCEYPEYTKRAAHDIAVTGLVQVPVGTRVTIEAESNKPLVSVQLDVVAPDKPPETRKLDLVAQAGQPQTRFSFPLDALDSDRTVLCTLLDVDGIRNRDPVRLSLGAVPDEAPQVNVQLVGIGTAITPEARLPVAGDVLDDYGVANIWFEYHVDETAPVRQPLSVTASGRDKLAIQDALEAGPLGLQPKQKLSFAVAAADTYALADAPNVGASQRYVLDVVTAAQLRAILEARELLLRRRFETMIGEFTETRDLLARIEFAADKPAGTVGTGDSNKPGTDAGAANKPPAGDEPEDAIRNVEKKTPEQLRAYAYSQAERVLQNTQRSGHETLEVAESFDAIRAELFNNRIETEELKTRLKDGIADPLRKIVSDRFPALDLQLRDLRTKLGDPQAAALQTAAVATRRQNPG